MRISPVFVGLLVAAPCNAWAERTPPRPLPLSASADAARVIVQFKDDAPVLRAHALSAGVSLRALDSVLGARAQTLGARHGMALSAGAAVGERQQVIHGPKGMTSQTLADQLSRDPDVAWAEPDRRVRRTLLPNDTLFNAGGAQGPAVGQWYLRAPTAAVASSINAVTAWDTTTGSASVIVAVLDTGVRANHPDLAGKVVGGYDFVSNQSGEPAISNDGDGRDADPSDPGDWLTQSEIAADPTFWEGCVVSSSSWHGTMVSGIIGAATGNGAGMAGAGWNVRVMPVRVLGKCFGYTSDIVAAMRWSAGIAVPGVPANPNPAKVINLSLGSSASPCSAAQQSAVAEINARGAVVVAAAGNSAGRAASSPANCPGVIGVAAVRHVGSKVGFSDIGPELAIAAPGGNCVNVGPTDPCLYPILTTVDSGSQGPVGPAYTDSFNISVGTSFAAPLVSGTAALMLSAQPSLTPAALKAAMQSSARAFPSSGLTDDASGQPVPLQACSAPGSVDQLQCYCTKTTCGAGLLDAGAAVAAALGVPTPTPTPEPPSTTGDGDGGGGGGGGMSAAWLLALAAAALLLWRRKPARVLGALAVVGAAALLAAAPSPTLAAQRAAMVNGVIVQLRDAPTHAELMRERAQSSKPEVASREQGRWRDVVAALPAEVRVAERRAVGASAQLLRFERPMSAQQAQAFAAQLEQRPDVAWATPNTRERRLQAAPPANAPPSDPVFGGQWWLQPVAGSDGVPLTQRLRGVPGYLSAWTSVTTGSSNSLIAVLDNGIVDHPDLAGKVINGYDMVSDVDYSNDGDGRDADPSDPGDWVDANDRSRDPTNYSSCAIETSSWHGTAIAGMLVGVTNNGVGGASMNWPGRVLAVRVAAKCGADVADIVDGMRWAAGLQVCRRSDAASGACLEFVPNNPNPARVVNISFGGDGNCTPYQGAIDELRNRRVVVVAAAGNEHAATPTRPAKCPGVIGVGALNRDGFKTNYSNFGSGVVVSTVGGDDGDGAWGRARGAGSLEDSGLLSVGNLGDTAPQAPSYFSYFGTSFSTPIVAGAVSLMLAVNPNLTPAQIEQGLRVSARPHVTSNLPGVAACSNANPGRCLCTASTCGAGILDVPQALAYAAAPASYVAPARPSAVVNAAELRDAAALGPDRPSNAPPSTPPGGGGGNGGDGGSDGGGGGGAMSAWWLAALAAAVLALRRRAARR
jgi:serine protease